MDLEKQVWDEAYERGGNILFYPHEEVIRFVNKYVRKRVGLSEFKDVAESLKFGGKKTILEVLI